MTAFFRHRRTTMRALSFVSMMTVLLIGIAPVSCALADTTKPPTDNAMTSVEGPFDSLSVRASAFANKEKRDSEKGAGKILTVVVAPLHIEYPKKRRDLRPYYRNSDFQLSPRDIELLQKTIADTFTASWFKKRHWQLVTDPASADIRLNIDLKDFWLVAPLRENIAVYRTFAEESARFTLSGHVERVSDGQRLIEFSDKRKVRQLGTQPGRFERFTTITFWRDMRLELGSFASQLNHLVPQAAADTSASLSSRRSLGISQGKNGHNA